jgi:hypothetical protein
MAFDCINSRADLDALAGTPEHAQMMAALAATLWRLERDDEAQTWRAVKDDSVITRWGFKRTDFKGTKAPELPPYVAPEVPAPAPVSMRQARLALLEVGLLDAVQAALDALPDAQARRAAQIEWESAQEVRFESPLVQLLAPALQLDDGQLRALFERARVL